ncbi:hypothetical protein SLEP1_g9997 [Rubroshorea leprosula]|uniref:Uncharacterized protein n=1 Tax=Rubroshorea leprosula TaxID=152421 RepID=A0AAV5II12_9ROSI|nr:hypothetical protein SLEP1_g9997 [Rubroshorea leprosula]
MLFSFIEAAGSGRKWRGLAWRSEEIGGESHRADLGGGRPSREQNKKELALREKASIQQKLDSKFEELSKLKLECSRLEKGNMALAKELTVLKLCLHEFFHYLA